MKKQARTMLKRWLSVVAAILLVMSVFPAAAYAAEENQNAGYQLKVAVEGSESPTVGDTVTFTAKVTYNGEEITNLEEAGLHLWYWTDVWSAGKTTADGYKENGCSYINYDSVNGYSFTTDVKFDEEGKYSIAAELKNDSSRLAMVNTDFTVKKAEEPIEIPTVPLKLDNADFENGKEGWTTTPEDLIIETDQWMTNNTSHYLKLWVSDTETTDLNVSYEIEDLAAGTYQASIDMQGWGNGETGLSLYVADKAGKALTEKTVLTTSDYNNWSTFKTNTFTLTEPTTVVVTVAGTTPAGFWGSLDNLVVLGPEEKEDEEDTSVPGQIEVQKVQNLSEDFIMGVDISTIVSQYNSGVIYKDFDGNELKDVTEFCKFLAKDCGINSVRVRVWNDPFDAEDNGYGAGNCDVNTAAKIGEACAAAGIHMLIDFHYSDFWADPGRQLVPKAWKGYTVEQKEEVIRNYTYESLKTIAATGAKISMVQVGNETNSAVCGENNVENMCKLFTAGSNGVRTFAKETYGDEKAVKVAIHVANPNKGAMTTWAKNLDTYHVDYDVMATSYYVFWHGTLSNLKSQMKAVQDTYGKEVMVAETSYIYTSEDTDGKANGISSAAAGYEISAQGQAASVRDIIDAVNTAGGLGVYYWEPAWITVGDITGLEGDELNAQIAENQKIWEKYGSGWASSYAQEYDPNSVGTYGGSEWDNQALFDAKGNPLPSLHVWNYVKTGATIKELFVSGVVSPELEVSKGETVTLPETVAVSYNKPSVGTMNEKVTWNEEDVAAINIMKPGIYTVRGVAALSQECTDGTTQVDVECTVIVLEGNLITDADAAGFEKADPFIIDGKGVKAASTEDVLEGSKALHWYSASATETAVTYKEPIALSAGYYTFEALAMGAVNDEVTVSVLDKDGNVLFTGEPAVLTGYTMEPDKFQTPYVTFVLDKDTEVMLRVTIKIADGGWGSADAMYLHQHETLGGVSNGEGTHTHDLVCGDCGEVLGTALNCEYELTETVEAGKEPGYKEYTCAICGDSYREVIPVKDPEDPSEPDKPSVPEETVKPSDTTKPAQIQNKKTSGVKTGDDSMGLLYGVTVIGTAVIVGGVLKKKRSR